MACNATPQALTYRISQEPTDCIRILTSRRQLHGDSTVPTSSTYPSPSGSEAIPSSLGELSKPCGFLTLARIDPYDPTKPCYLFAIPRELRDMILGDVIASGHPKILRTSRKLHEEGTELLYKRGICRLNMDFTNYTAKFSLQKPIATLIQNVNIEIEPTRQMDDRVWNQKVEIFRKFSGSSVSRKDCRVVLLFAYFKNSLNKVPYFKLWMHMLQTLIGFSRITLEVRFRGRMSVSKEEIWPRWQMGMMEKAAQILRCAFGSCTWRDTVDSDRIYLEFHPRGHLIANPGSLPPKVQDRIDRWYSKR